LVDADQVGRMDLELLWSVINLSMEPSMTAQPQARHFLPTLQRSATTALTPLQRELSRLFEDFSEGWQGLTYAPIMPKMDVRYANDQVEVTVELPGIDQADIKIAFDNDVLTISGEKKSAKETKDENYRLSERSYGAFSRSIAMPANIDAEKIDAVMKDGILTIRAPRSGEGSAKTIKIQSAK